MCVCVCVCVLCHIPFVISHWKYHAPTVLPLLLVDFNTYLFALNSPLRVAWCILFLTQTLQLMTIFGDIICPKFWCCISRRCEGLWGTFWSSLAAGISSGIHHQNSFVTEDSLKVHLQNYLKVRCFIIHHSTLHQLLLLISINKTYSKPAVLPFKSCNWSPLYQLSSVSLIPVLLSNQPHSQHWHTSFWPSHSGYNSA